MIIYKGMKFNNRKECKILESWFVSGVLKSADQQIKRK